MNGKKAETVLKNNFSSTSNKAKRQLFIAAFFYCSNTLTTTQGVLPLFSAVRHIELHSVREKNTKEEKEDTKRFRKLAGTYFSEA